MSEAVVIAHDEDADVEAFAEDFPNKLACGEGSEGGGEAQDLDVGDAGVAEEVEALVVGGEEWHGGGDEHLARVAVHGDDEGGEGAPAGDVRDLTYEAEVAAVYAVEHADGGDAVGGYGGLCGQGRFLVWVAGFFLGGGGGL